MSTPKNHLDPIGDFEQFWPFYLSQHQNRTSRWLHFVGTTCALSCFFTGLLTLTPLTMLIAPAFGYGPAWVGHFFFEKNRPATFKYPVWSLRGDFKMFFLMLRGQLH